MRMLLAVCALAGASFAFQAPAPRVDAKPVDKAAPARSALLEKMAVIGASLSAGFRLDGNQEPMARSKVQLSNVIDASISGPHAPVDNQASAMFFLDPVGNGKRALERFKASPPTAIVAIDYLFWFGYGLGADDKRSEKLEKALQDLEPFRCPILLGDLPDMSAATKVQEPMLEPAMVPPPETLKKLNARIAAWAKDKPNVVLVPLADITAKLQSDEQITARDNHWPKGSITRLMQADRLHPTLEGTCAVWVVAVDAWLKADKGLAPSSFELDVAKLLPKIRAAKPEPAPVAPAGKESKPVPK